MPATGSGTDIIDAAIRAIGALTAFRYPCDEYYQSLRESDGFQYNCGGRVDIMKRDIIDCLCYAVAIAFSYANCLTVVIYSQQNLSTVSIGKSNDGSSKIIWMHGPEFEFDVQVLALGDEHTEIDRSHCDSC